MELVAADGLVERLRRRKDEAELAAIAEAARIADDAYETVLAGGLAGAHRARGGARPPHARIRELGAEPSFPAIVAAGANGALPHAEPSEREIARASWSCGTWARSVDGYCSDCTRTFAVGRAPSGAREVYELVRAAQQAGLDAVRPGVGGEEADEAARAVIREGGHEEHFGHGLGHGVGLEVHEAPRLGKTSEDVLERGEIVTVEPGDLRRGRVRRADRGPGLRHRGRVRDPHLTG